MVNKCELSVNRRHSQKAKDAEATSSPKRPSAPDTYSEGNAGRQVGESQSCPTSADFSKLLKPKADEVLAKDRRLKGSS
jgi:hypothetical protein